MVVKTDKIIPSFIFCSLDSTRRWCTIHPELWHRYPPIRSWRADAAL